MTDHWTTALGITPRYGRWLYYKGRERDLGIPMPEEVAADDPLFSSSNNPTAAGSAPVADVANVREEQ